MFYTTSTTAAVEQGSTHYADTLALGVAQANQLGRMLNRNLATIREFTVG
jgi:hypothetical protein